MATAVVEPYIDGSEVRRRYRISMRTFRRWLQDEALGFPQPLQINRRYLFKVADLEQWEAAHALAPKEASQEPALKIVSDVIQDYPSFVRAMVARRHDLELPCMEVDARSGMQEGYANKLENWEKPYGKGLGPVVFPLWLGGLDVGVVLVDLPRRPQRSVDEATAA